MPVFTHVWAVQNVEIERIGVCIRTRPSQCGQLRGATVVLSACSTGRGKASGADLISLPSAVLYAGAGAVLNGLWQVDDSATALMMQYFYQALTQESLDRAAALHHAQLKMLSHEQFSAPYYWAPFILTGAADKLGVNSEID